MLQNVILVRTNLLDWKIEPLIVFLFVLVDSVFDAFFPPLQ